jgi:ribosomal subunit interface protein
MQVRVSGKQIEIGEALSQHVRTALEARVKKLFERGGEASVVFSHEGPFYRADCMLHLDSGVTLQAQGEDGDVHKAFDLALEHMEKRIRRHRRRMKSHHGE